MPVATETDIVGALVSRIRGLTSVAALTSTRVSAQQQASWATTDEGMLRYAILVNGPLGGPGDQGLGLTTERFDLWCYGADARSAKVLADRLMFSLLVSDRSAANAFTAAGTRVHMVQEAGGRIALEDPDTKQPYVVCQILATYSAVPV